MPNCLFALILTDGLQLPSGFVAPSAKTLILYALVPAHWTDGAFGAADDGEWSDAVTLRPEATDRILEALYGRNWLAGNADGSRYVIRSTDGRAHHPAYPWSNAPNPDFQYHYFQAEDDDSIRPVSAEVFGAAYARMAADSGR